MPIPRRIIQTARSSDLPPAARAAAANLKLLHPEWEHVFFDDAAVTRFVSHEFPQWRHRFDTFPHRIQKFDFFRYLAVYRLGGFYFDLDVYFWEPLDSLLPHRCVFPFEELTLSRYLRSEHGIDWEIGNYGFGAEAGDPFLAAVIKNCDRAQRDAEWTDRMMRGIPRMLRPDFEVLNTTGPGLVTRTLAENPSLARHVTVLSPDNVLDERSWHKFGSFGTHHMEASWRRDGNLLIRKLGQAWENWERRRLMHQSREYGPTRTFPEVEAA